MKVLSSVRSWFTRSKPAKVIGPARRNYDASTFDRLTADLGAALLSPDSAIWGQLPTLRNRARTLERVNPYARKFLRIVEKKIVGCGFTLQEKAKLPDGSLDKITNDIVEAGWSKWSKRRYCSVDGRLSWHRVERTVTRTVARDGEILVRLVRGFANKFGFAVQLIEPDHLDDAYNDTLRNGNEVRAGVELNEWKAPVAFHVLVKHPGDWFSGFNRVAVTNKRERIEARDIVYVGLADRVGATRSVPWLTCVMLTLNHLHRYEEAEVIAARMQANNQGFYEKTVPEALPGGVELFEGFEEGELPQESAPGTMTELPVGVSAKLPQPTHPNPAFAEARKAFLRAAASGLDVGYSALGSDYKDANYSSLRAASLDENDGWKMLQTFIIDDLETPVFEAWLESAIFSGALPLRMADYDRLVEAAEFKARGFPYVDPAKEMAANILAVENGFTSRRQIVAAGGGDIGDVYDEIAADEALAKEKGITIPSGKSAAPAAPVGTATPPPQDDDDEPKGEDDKESDDALRMLVARMQTPAPVTLNIKADALTVAQPVKKSVTFRTDADGRMLGADVVETTSGEAVKPVLTAPQRNGHVTTA